MTEQRARERELAFRAISDAVVITDAEGRIRDWNPAAERMFGRLRRGLRGRMVSLLHGPGARRRFVEQVAASLRTRDEWKGELPFRRPDGGMGLAEATVVALRDDDGALAGMVAVERDVTDRRRGEQERRDGEARFRAVFQNSGIGICLVAPDGTMLEANPAFGGMLGYAADELRGRSILDLTHPDDVRASGDMLREASRGERDQHRADKRYLHRDGRPVWARLTASSVRDAGGALLYRVAMIEDVTLSRRHADESRRLAAIVRTTSDAVVTKALDGTVLSWNPAAERMFGWSEAEMLGAPIYLLVPPERHAEEAELLARVARGELVANFETERVCRDGRPIRVSLTVSAIPDGSGRVVAASAIARDVTQQRLLEEQLRAAQRMEAVGRLAGGVAHDFNNLLTAIKGNAALVLMDLADDDPLREDVREIEKAADRAADLTRQLLAYSRRQVLQPRVLDVNDAVRDLQRMLRRLVEENVEFVVSLAPSLGRVRADPGQLDQVLVNLVVNARDATPPGGRITVSTSPFRVGTDGAGAPAQVPAGEYVRVEVADTGSGIEPRVLPQIFEPFFTTKPPGHGTGLGLATVYGIVTQSGGAVWAESEPGRGARFVVLLPVTDETPRPDGGVSSAAAARGDGSGTVLIVEDEEAVLALARRALERAGFRVLQARSAGAADALAAAEPGIDLLLTDVVMPGEGGARIAERLAARWPGLRVLFMSGYAGDAVVAHGLPPGVELVAKPFSPAELVRRVSEAMRRPAPGPFPPHGPGDG